jgi:hypothetical protein
MENIFANWIGTGAAGATPQAQYLTAREWRGSSSLRLELPLHFFAVSDSTDEVIRPIKNLIRMSLPRLNTSSNPLASIFELIPPGPRPDPGGLFGKVFPVGGLFRTVADDINVYVGNFLRLKKVFISSLPVISFKGRLSAQSSTDPGGLPMEGKCTVIFETVYSATSNDVQQYLLSGITGPNAGDTRPNPTLT